MFSTNNSEKTAQRCAGRAHGRTGKISFDVHSRFHGVIRRARVCSSLTFTEQFQQQRNFCLWILLEYSDVSHL